jgi:hypothetical protein
MAALGALALVAVIIAAAFGAGACLLARLPGWQSRWERFVYATALGLGILAYAVLGVGLVGWLRLPVVLTIIGFMLACHIARPKAESGPEASADVQQPSPAIWAAALCLSAIALLALLAALVPPGETDWDGLSYHLAVPKIYVRAGGIHYIGWMSHSNFPFTWEMLYTVGLMLHGAGLAKLMHWLAACLTAAAGYFIARQMAGRRAGLLAACCCACMPLAAWQATVAGNDLAASLYTVLSLGAFLHWRRDGGTGWLLTCGALAGFAAGCKMTAVLVIAFLALATTVESSKGRRLTHAAQFLALSLAIASPWYIKSAVWTGNPVYPFFYHLFGGKYWSASAAAQYSQEQISFGMGRGPLAFLLLPWNLTMHGSRFSNLPGLAFTIITQSLGPLLLAMVPLVWLSRLKRDEKILLVYSAVALAAWFWMSQHIRYVLPIGAVLCVMAGIGAERAAQAGIGKVVGLAYVSAGLWTAFGLGLGVIDSSSAALGLEKESNYLARTLRVYPMVEKVNSLPENAKVIMYGETRGFYFDRDYMWGNHHHEMLRYDRMTHARELAQAYRDYRATHVLMTRSFLDAVRKGEQPLSKRLREAIAQRLLHPAAESRGYVLFEIRQANK